MAPGVHTGERPSGDTKADKEQADGTWTSARGHQNLLIKWWFHQMILGEQVENT